MTPGIGYRLLQLLRRLIQAEAYVHDVGSTIHCPQDAIGYCRRIAPAPIIGHFNVHYQDIGSHSINTNAVTRICSYYAGDMRTMAVKVVYYRAFAEVDLRHNPADQILMVPVDAGIEDSNQDIVATSIKCPGLRPVDLAKGPLPIEENVAAIAAALSCDMTTSGWTVTISPGTTVARRALRARIFSARVKPIFSARASRPTPRRQTIGPGKVAVNDYSATVMLSDRQGAGPAVGVSSPGVMAQVCEKRA